MSLAGKTADPGAGAHAVFPENCRGRISGLFWNLEA